MFRRTNQQRIKAMAAKSPFRSISGRRFGIGPYGNATANPEGASAPIDLTPKAARATITISAEGATVANQRDITIALKDVDGNAIDYAETFEIRLYASSALLDFVAVGGTTGIAAGASGKVMAVVAKKLFRAITTAAGVCQVIYTDIGTDAGYLAVALPSGIIVPGGVITNA
jgi:hypothetical protein